MILRLLGTKAQTVPTTIIIAKTLNSHWQLRSHRASDKWKNTVALPAWPQADIHPTVPLMRWRGRTRVVWCMATGYIDLKRCRCIETEMAAATNKGTSQTINSKLGFSAYSYLADVTVGQCFRMA
jgi:hypothetical protein